MKRKFFSAVLSAAVFAIASVGITASAEEVMTDKSVQVQEVVTEIPASESAAELVNDTLEEQASSESTEETTIDFFADDYYDTNGNATLIQEENIIYNSEEMQFIAVTTKDGHVFYVLINYSAETARIMCIFSTKLTITTCMRCSMQVKKMRTETLRLLLNRRRRLRKMPTAE